ncbi:hypothetical protein Tco_0689737, partial [Tanacetum coccineum]
TSLLSSLFPNLHQSTPILTPTNTEATTLTSSILESETVNAIHLILSDLEKEVKELKNVDHSSALLSKINSEVPNAIKEYLGTSLDDALYKVLKKHDADIIKEHSVSAEIVKRLRQQYVPEKSTEYIRKIKMEHARKQQEPKETITSSDTTALEEFDQKTTLFETMTKFKSFNKRVADELKKRKQDDADKDEGPSAGLDQGLKRRKTSKDTKPSKKAKSTETSKGMSKSQPKSTQATPMYDWFKKPERPLTRNSDWNVRKSIYFRPPQTWISKIAQAENPPLSFDELISTPIDFSAYVMNHLKIDKLTQEHIVGPTFNLLKGTCKSKEYPFDLSKLLPLIMNQGRQVVLVDFFINNDLEYLKGGSSTKKYMTSTSKTKASKYDILGIEDMVPSLWILVKVRHLQQNSIHCIQQSSRNYFKDKYKRNRLMRTDEIYKFSDETLISVRTVLHNVASNMRMDYLLKRR